MENTNLAVHNIDSCSHPTNALTAVENCESHFNYKDENIIFKYFKDISDDTKKYQYAYFIELYLKNGFNEIEAYKSAFEKTLKLYEIALSDFEISQLAKQILSHPNSKDFLSYLTNILFNDKNITKNLINSKIFELLNAKTKKIFFHKNKKTGETVVVEREIADYKTQKDTLITLLKIESETNKNKDNNVTGNKNKYIINFNMPRPKREETITHTEPQEIKPDIKELEFENCEVDEIYEVVKNNGFSRN